MEKENQRVALTKHLLKQGLLRLLNDKDLDRISVSELCRISGVNRATFYRHFQTPSDILRAIEMDIVREIRSGFTIPRSRKDMEANFEKVCTFLYEHTDLFRVLMRNNTDADLMHLIRSSSEDILAERRLISQFDDLDPDSIRLMTTFFGGGGYLLLRRWLMEDIQKTPQEITQLLVRIADIGSFID